MMPTAPTNPCPICILLDCGTQFHVQWHEGWVDATMAAREEIETLRDLLVEHDDHSEPDDPVHAEIHHRARAALDPMLDQARDNVRFEATQALFALTDRVKLNDSIVRQAVAEAEARAEAAAREASDAPREAELAPREAELAAWRAEMLRRHAIDAGFIEPDLSGLADS